MDVNVTVYIPTDDINVAISIDEGVTVKQFNGNISPDRQEWGQNGFINLTESTMAFNDGNRTFTITPVGDQFYYYVLGRKFVKTSADSIVIDDTIGLHAIYYDDDTLTTIVNPTHAQIEMIMKTKASVTYIYWNKTIGEQLFFQEERHGFSMSPVTHAYLHDSLGLAYESGLALNTMDVDGSGNDNSAAQFGIDSGDVLDEDLETEIDAVLNTAGCPIYYMLGSTPEWNKTINTGYSVRTFDNTDATRLAYNEFTGGAWQLTQASTNKFVLCHILATTDKNLPMISVMGQAEYATIIDARNGADTEILALTLTDLSIQELRPIATVILQTVSAYTNDVKARVRSTDTGDNYIDWRSSTISKTIAGTSHGDLSGLGADDHTQYLLADGTRAGAISQIQSFTNGITDGTLSIADGEITDIEHLSFNISHTPDTPTEGQLCWNSDDGTLSLGMPGGNVNLQMGQEVLIRVKNDSGVSIPSGSPVYVSGASGNRPEVTKASAVNHIVALSTIAVATETIADGQFGYVTTFGYVRDIDTDFVSADGQPAFLSTTAGEMSASLPTQPNTQVFMGVVITKHATAGVLLVKIISRPNMDELSDVLISGVANNDMIYWDNGNSRWANKTLATLTGEIDHDSLLNTHNLTTDINHDALTNYVANEHIDWTNGSANNFDTAGTGNFDGALTIGAFTLPNTDGTSGQVLQTNGSGTVTWQTAAGGGGGWQDDGTVVRLLTVTDNVNVGGTTDAGTSGEGVLVIEVGTAPTSSPTDVTQLYSAVGLNSNVLTDGAKWSISVGSPLTLANLTDEDTSTTGGDASHGGTTGVLKYDFGSGNSATLSQITVGASDTAYANSPSTFTLDGSNNDSDWTQLSSQSSLSWTSGQVRDFTLSNVASYRYYRLSYTALQSGDEIRLGYISGYESGAELIVRDSNGNITTLSPHTFSLVKREHDLAWSYHSEQDGNIIETNMYKAIRLLENISGVKLLEMRDSEGNDISDFVGKGLLKKLTSKVTTHATKINALQVAVQRFETDIATLNKEIEVLKQAE